MKRREWSEKKRDDIQTEENADEIVPNAWIWMGKEIRLMAEINCVTLRCVAKNERQYNTVQVSKSIHYLQQLTWKCIHRAERSGAVRWDECKNVGKHSVRLVRSDLHRFNAVHFSAMQPLDWQHNRPDTYLMARCISFAVNSNGWMDESINQSINQSMNLKKE